MRNTAWAQATPEATARLSGSGRRLRHRLTLALLLSATSLAVACGGDEPPSTERILLQRELDSLAAYRDTQRASPLEDGNVVLVIDERAIGRLIAAALPTESTVADRYRIRLESAEVTFRTAMASVRFAGRVSLVERPSVFVDAVVHGLYEILDLDPKTGVLRGRVEVLTIEAQEVSVGGWSAPAARLATELARRRGQDFNELVDPIEIPVVLERDVQLPAVRDDDVTIEPATIPVSARLVRVLSAGRRLWVLVDTSVGPVGALTGGSRSAMRRTPTSAVPATDSPAGNDPPSIGQLRERVAALRAEVELRLGPELTLASEQLASAELVVGTRIAMLERLLQAVASHYLNDVKLHLRPGIVVPQTDRVHVRIGFIRAYAGRWDLNLTLQSIEATLRAGTPEMAVAEANRLSLRLPVQVVGAAGRANIDFRWDAALVVGAICGDFAIDEPFSATVQDRSFELSGHFRVYPDAGHVVLVPEFQQRLTVSPEPTDTSWARVREILASQDKIFRCGLALDPEAMEEKLRGLLGQGFRFRLPNSILQPVELPAAVSETLELGGRQLEVAAQPAGVLLTPEWLWYGIGIDLSAR